MTGRAAIGARNLLWGALMLVIAITAVGVQLDFATRSRPALAPIVPEIFRAHAYVSLAVRAVESGQGAEGLQFAEALILARPIPAESASILALVAQEQGQVDIASQALTISASRGWREPVAQIGVINGALAAEDWRVLAERLDALQRIGNADLVPQDVLTTLLANSSGREELANRLVQDRNWLDRFLRLGMSEIPPAEFGETVQLIHRMGGQPDCRQLSAAALSLVRQAEITAAQQVWAGQCTTRGQESAAGFRPDTTDVVRGPMDWAYPNQPGLNRSFRENDGRWVIDYTHRDNLIATLAERYMHLTSGPHRLVLSQDAAVSGSEVSFQIQCVGKQSNRLLPIERVANEHGFAVPSDCPVQQMRVRVSKGNGKEIHVVTP